MSRGCDEQVAAGRAELSASGVAEGAADPAALLALAGRSEALDRAIVERLDAAPSDRSAAALRELETGAELRGWKAAAKDARRALYRFTQRGIAVPAPPATVPSAARPPAPSLEGYLSAVDGRGDRLVWLVRPQRQGGLLVLTAVVNEPAGMRDVALAELGRKALRRMDAELRSKHGLRMVEADGAYCDALLAEAYERARAAATPGIGEYPTFRARMTTRAATPRGTALIERVLSPGELAGAGAVTHAAALLDEPEFLTWGLDEPALRPYLDALLAVQESPLLLSRPQQEERVEGIVRRALRELFAAPAATAWQRRLEEMAYYLHATGRRELALGAAATARALGESGTGGEGIPFFERLTQDSIAALAHRESERAQDQARSSFLVKPSAAMSSRPGLVRDASRRLKTP